tara:strand:+ start:97 stop:375 length:279 start_codon:yes stop_codon:yes gene_type:complete
MYPDTGDELCASMVGGGSEAAAAHQGHHHKKAVGLSAAAKKEVEQFNEAFSGLYLPQIQLKAAEIKKANFASMANGDLLVQYLETDLSAGKL